MKLKNLGFKLVLGLILVSQMLIGCGSAIVTIAPSTPTATPVASPTPVLFSVKVVLVNLLSVKSFKAVTTSAINRDKVSQTYVAPDKLSTTTETNGFAIYFAVVGKTAYISDDNRAWRKVEKAVWTVEALFRLPTELSQLPDSSWTQLPDETGNVGVAQLKNYTVKDESFTPQTPINLTLKYDKTKLRLLELAISDERFSQKTVYSHYDDSNNKVEVAF
jgi:hypothetical protein